MPNIKSSKKDVIRSKIAYEKNKADKSALKTAVKKFEAAVAGGDQAAAEAAHKAAVQAVGDHSLLDFRKYEFVKETQGNIEGVIALWDFWNERQRHYMALDR